MAILSKSPQEFMYNHPESQKEPQSNIKNILFINPLLGNTLGKNGVMMINNNLLNVHATQLSGALGKLFMGETQGRSSGSLRKTLILEVAQNN